VDRSRSAELRRGEDRYLSRPGGQIGVIDVGSNTARFVVFEASQAGTVRAVYEAKEVPRLGLGTGPDGRLADEAIHRGVAGLRRFARLVRSLGVSKTLAVATSAVRDAPNGPDFVRAVARSTGLLLRTISGVEEARYAYLGVASAWELRNDVVCDLGGGSLQLVEVHRGTLRNSVSLPLGVLRLSQRFFDHDPPKRREWEELRDHVRETLESTFEAFQSESRGLYAVGGTVRSLARAAIDFREWPIGRVHGYPLFDHDVEALGELLGEMPADKRRAIPGIGSDRADVVLAGIVVLKELLRVTRAEQIYVSGTGIREGIALEAVGAKLPAKAVQLAERSVAAAAESFRFDLEHGREVADAAVGLFEQLAEHQGWGASEELAVRVASGMHDAGTAIDLWRHAHHSAYLIQNYPIQGLNQREILLASMAAYLHEGGPLPSEWKKEFQPVISADDLDLARQLGAVVGLAELVSAFRPRFSTSGDGRTIGLAFSPPSGTATPGKLGERAAKILERAFDVEVKVRES
jgi:exopolyphosphatase / guanosine-5'-triphosphate,3'-diphosphate pyrophosphatase